MWLTYEEHELPVRDGGVNWDEKKLEEFFTLQDRLQDEGRCVSTGAHLSRTASVIVFSVICLVVSVELV